MKNRNTINWQLKKTYKCSNNYQDRTDNFYLRKTCRRLPHRLLVWSWQNLWKASLRLWEVCLCLRLLEDRISATSDSMSSTPSKTSLSLSLSLSLSNSQCSSRNGGVLLCLRNFHLISKLWLGTTVKVNGFPMRCV